VNRHWPERSSAARESLSHQLQPVLEGLLVSGVPVTDDHRSRCEDVVLQWAEY
jgi:hypothetical protein